MCKELGQLTQGYRNTTGTNTMFFLTHKKVKVSQKIMLLHTRALWYTTANKKPMQTKYNPLSVKN